MVKLIKYYWHAIFSKPVPYPIWVDKKGQTTGYLFNNKEAAKNKFIEAVITGMDADMKEGKHVHTVLVFPHKDIDMPTPKLRVKWPIEFSLN